MKLDASFSLLLPVYLVFRLIKIIEELCVFLKFFTTITFVIYSFLSFYSSISLADPKRPFPQHVSYASGTIYPSNFSQAQQDQHVRNFYDYWKSHYLVSAGTNSAGKILYRVAFGQGSDVTVSEGQGYGMVIVALMAGHDPDAQNLFDGLWYFSREFPSGIDGRLMSWKIQNGSIVGRNDSAFDGDVDIAYGLLLAHEQWGSAGDLNYQAEAAQVIDGILASTIGADSLLPKLGDWTDDSGSRYNQYTPRSSDFMPAHFHAFARATGDAVWNNIVINSQAVIDSIQNNYSSSTGLLPDFIINCQSVDNCRPANESFLEGPNDGDYYYNAGRAPWRIGLDALLNDDVQSRAEAQKMISWLAVSTNSNANNIKAGYKLDGSAIGDYSTTFFAAPFAVAAMLDGSQQDFLNEIYTYIHNETEDYYEDSINLLALLAVTANYWNPATDICRRDIQRDSAWRVVEIYTATLGYAPDNEGLQYWVNNLQNGSWTPNDVAQSFFDGPLVQEMYPIDQGYGSFIDSLYQNLFGRAPDEAGYAYWLAELNSGHVQRNQMIIALIEGGWANAEAASDMERFGYRVQVGLAFAAEQARRGIVYSQLTTAKQEKLRFLGAQVLEMITVDSSACDTAVGNISRLLDTL
ncbi:glycosyl hydrolase family 8 [Thiorhodococcus drewsii]|uniref:glycosyl hydrolase family 8 n=1 Tax=Thiorhodococcus drewsii TaxID=210408 RepID=UPI000A06D28A|nr:glycosyl hydrolase family 8 [Thiorhodococcus drewsii]